MRIFAKKAFRFRGSDKAVSVAALSFADVPDWVKKDPIFALAVKEGSIELISSKADEKKVEKTGTAKPPKLPKEPVAPNSPDGNDGAANDGDSNGGAPVE